jgi:hypothetical protein
MSQGSPEVWGIGSVSFFMEWNAALGFEGDCQLASVARGLVKLIVNNTSWGWVFPQKLEMIQLA